MLYAGPILLGAYSVGAHAPWSRRAIAALAALAVAYDVIYLNAQGGLGSSFNAVVGVLVWLLLPTGAWLAGWYMRRRRRQAAAVAEMVRREREREQQRLAALEQERGRMARELHDILAHSVSLMGVQAGAAEQVLTSDPDASAFDARLASDSVRMSRRGVTLAPAGGLPIVVTARRPRPGPARARAA